MLNRITQKIQSPESRINNPKSRIETKSPANSTTHFNDATLKYWEEPGDEATTKAYLCITKVTQMMSIAYNPSTLCG